jgi:hypothetical protein
MDVNQVLLNTFSAGSLYIPQDTKEFWRYDADCSQMPAFEELLNSSSHKLLIPTSYVALPLTASPSSRKDDLLITPNSPDTLLHSSKSLQTKMLKVPSELQPVSR